ncbi:protein NRT1/ PTR FAMILY 5.2 [Dendrobium catenatum]|nr:protein NRT1/ PTR FAMILY 5.2 [Dendrobium catenatum]
MSGDECLCSFSFFIYQYFSEEKKFSRREMEEANGSEMGSSIFTKDGSVDLKGRPVLRSKRGGWTACYFIVVYEVFERMAYYGISSNLVIYLTKKLHQGTVASSNNVTYWTGTAFLSSIVGAYIADAHLGRFRTFSIFSVVYFLGMCLLTAAVSFRSLKPPPCNIQDIADAGNCKPASKLQLGIFFGALYIIALGTGGTKPNISTIGADQFDEFDPKERADKISFFNWWMFSIYLGTLFANIMLVYVQDNIGWTLGYGIPTVGLGISLVIFYAGTSFYRHKLPQGSPFTKMARVLVAAMRKCRVNLPKDSLKLYELDSNEYMKQKRFKIHSTNSMRFLNKAAVIVGTSRNPWKLCPVTHVEETKQMLRLIPVLIAMFIPSTMTAQVNTLFIKQGTTLNRHIGPHFQIPPASLASFTTISMLITIFLYDRFFVRIMRAWTKNPRGITLLQRIGVGLVFDATVMIVASLIEKRRLSVARENPSNGGRVPLTIFILLPQFVLMGVSEAFLVVGKIDFFYHQAPEGMKSLGTAYSLVTYGVGSFLSSFLLSLVANITQRNGRKGWILNNLNASHLDYYYGLLSILSFCNFFFFLIVCRFYVYKTELYETLTGEEKEELQEIQNRG